MAQNILLCQFCEISKEITWKCFNCDLVLCQKCAKQHSKFGGSKQHCIINLKQVGTPENVAIIQRFNLKNLCCPCHEEEKCSLYCKNCKKPVCSFCVIEPEHKGHNLDKLSNVYNIQLSTLNGIKEGIETDLTNLSKNVKDISSTFDNYNEIKQKIFQREKEIKERATEEAAKLINELDKHILPSKVVFMKEKQKIQDKERRLKETNQEVATALQSHQATCVLATMGKHYKHLPITPISDNIPLEQKFTFMVPDLPSINFGSVEKCPIFRLINTYETNVYRINKLKSLRDGTLICIHEKNEVDEDDHDFYIGYCYEQDDKSCIIQNEIYVSFSMYFDIDMTVTEDDTILINSNSNGILFLNAYDNELKIFEIALPPTNGTNIHVQTGIHSFDNSVLVGMIEFEPWNPEKLGMWGLISFDENSYCQELYRIPDSDSDPPIIDRVDKFTVNINGDINIIGWKKLLTVSLFGLRHVNWNGLGKIKINLLT
ncbi:TRIM36 [Mytilus coruscus]|uniref:TRIM36 n=1 Tax=Mytilus coruscus TaxID=42192 RepID=A0A6J8DI17_MYTCO|nr:TRIM36 [Mytilus coruscus]